MSDINIKGIEAKLKELEETLDALKAEKQNVVDPVIKGLDCRLSELDLSKASGVVHLHNAVISRLEELSQKVKALESKVSVN